MFAKYLLPAGKEEDRKKRRMFRKIDSSWRIRKGFIENHFITLSFISLGQKCTRDFARVFFRTRGTEAFNFERVNVFNFTAKSVRCRTLRVIGEAPVYTRTRRASSVSLRCNKLNQNVNRFPVEPCLARSRKQGGGRMIQEPTRWQKTDENMKYSGEKGQLSPSI